MRNTNNIFKDAAADLVKNSYNLKKYSGINKINPNNKINKLNKTNNILKV